MWPCDERKPHRTEDWATVRGKITIQNQSSIALVSIPEVSLHWFPSLNLVSPGFELLSLLTPALSNDVRIKASNSFLNPRKSSKKELCLWPPLSLADIIPSTKHSPDISLHKANCSSQEMELNTDFSSQSFR